MPASCIQNILKDKRKITVDKSLRLARYSNVSDKYYLNMQNDIDIHNVWVIMNNGLDKKNNVLRRSKIT